MPGFTIWLTACPRDDDASRFDAAQALMLHAPSYAARVHLSVSGMRIGHVGYPEYPVRVREAGDALLGVEGRIYNKSADRVSAELDGLAAVVFGEPAAAQDRVRQWILETDGEYVVVIASARRRELVVFTDPIGRLPLFYSADDRTLVVARECKFVQRLKPNPAYDPIAWGEIIWCGFPLGQRTTFQDVRRCHEATLLRARLRDDAVETEAVRLHTLDLDARDGARSAKEHASILVDLLTESCRQFGSHPDATTNVVSLSGGLDSRAVAVGLQRARVPFVAATYSDHRGAAATDVRIAKQLAALLDVPSRVFDLPAPAAAQVEAVAYMKDGLNTVGMAFILPFLQSIADEWGRGALYIGGDAGYLTKDPRLVPRITSFDGLLEAIIATKTLVPMERAERVMRLRPGTLREDLRQLMTSYSERDPDNMGARFNRFDRERFWGFEGEDRVRYYLWQTCPFYSRELFEHCFRIPDALKEHGRLRGMFLDALSSACARLPDAASGVPPGSSLFSLRYRARRLFDFLPRPVQDGIRRIAGRAPVAFTPPAGTEQYLRAQFQSAGPLASLMEPNETLSLLRDVDASTFDVLWTLVQLEKVQRERGV
jgi:asparagine synthase (glutamine-hydrolysing)